MTMQDDVFGSAGVPEEQKPRYFDLLELDGWHGVFNPRPERYDDQNDDHQKLAAEKGLVIFYEYTFIPVGSKGQVITRTATKNSREWREIFNSLKELWGMTDDVAVSKKIGETFHVQNGGGYVARELVQHGTYTNKAGEVKPNWASKIVELFDNEAAAVAAHDAFYNVTTTDEIPGFSEPTDEQVYDRDSLGEKSTAMAFLPQFVKMAQGDKHIVDRDKLAAFINDNPVLSAHFTMESTEVQDAINDVETEPPF